MTVPVHQRSALLLVVLGQAVGAFGLPVPAGARLAACGCRAEDRGAGRCCCAPHSATGCCPVESE
ncbi:MAG TPA: hypothetical protein VM597_30840, partial [Gemmataceae bacterium]|nr:hypothetical protein [Gemmataceae bacterium]